MAILRHRADDEIPAGWSVAEKCLAGIGREFGGSGGGVGAVAEIRVSPRSSLSRDSV